MVQTDLFEVMKWMGKRRSIEMILMTNLCCRTWYKRMFSEVSLERSVLQVNVGIL